MLRSLHCEGGIGTTIKKAKKILTDNTNIVHYFCKQTGQDIPVGTLREIFFVNQLAYQQPVYYTTYGDYTIHRQGKKYCFEIGGKSKKADQLKQIDHGYVIKDDILIGSTNTIPLRTCGFLY